MYNLGNQFKFDLSNSTAKTSVVFKGNKYRITVLTERLVRLEYNENGEFNDYPTELVLYRNLPEPQFNVEENNKTIKITTKYFELFYIKEKKFLGSKISPSSNLRINLLGTDKIWYYNHPEIRNFGIKVSNDKKGIKRGLYSLDGFASIDDSKSSIIMENGQFKEREKCIDTYVFLYNKDFYNCLNDYFMITGYPPLIPRYALGNWWDKNEFYNEFNLLHQVRKFEEKNVPVSVFNFNKWNNNDYNFNKDYTDIKSIIEILNKKNIKVSLSISDSLEFKVNTDENNKLKPYLSVDSNGNIPFNLYDARTIDAYLKLLIHPLDSLGVDFYSINKNGNDLSRLNKLRHYLYYDNFRYDNKRPLIGSYNSLIASHRYPVCYSGKMKVEWNSLKDILSFNMSAFNLGISFWCHDIGGTSGGIEDSELFTRFVQLGVFSPILKLSSDEGKYYKREPWKWGLKTSIITSDYLNLRYKLIPYLYTECYKYFKYGKPLIEPIFYSKPKLYDDPIYSNGYYFGSNLYVSPILTKKDYIMNRVIHKIYIPDGIWYDFFTGKKYTGNKKYVSFYKDEEYPVFVKAGTIIPMALNTFNDISSPKNMEIQIFPGASNTYSIYEDDGVTNSYLKGEHLITNIEFLYNKNNYNVTILPVSGKVGIVPLKRNYKIRLKNTKVASKILTYVGGTQVENNYYKDDTDLVIEVYDIPTNIQFTLICSGEDIEIDALRIINEDIVSIISDLPIKTSIKQKIDNIMFNDSYTLKKKRIEIRKLAHDKEYLEKKYVELFLKLLEYIKEV